MMGMLGDSGLDFSSPEEPVQPENKGLAKARKVLEQVHARHPYMSLADVFVLGGYVAFEATGGPVIPFAIGRKDFTADEAYKVHGAGLCPYGDGAHNPCGSRLPAADLGPDPACPASAVPSTREKPTIDATRATFERMG